MATLFDITDKIKNLFNQGVSNFQKSPGFQGAMGGQLHKPLNTFTSAVGNQVKNTVKQGVPATLRLSPPGQLVNSYQNFRTNANPMDNAKRQLSDLGSAGSLALTGVGLPKVGLTGLGVSAGIGGGLNKAFGGSFAEGAGIGVGSAPILAGIGRFTNPLINNAVSKVAPNLSNPVSKYLAQGTARGALNIPEGAIMGGALGRNPLDPAGIGLDFASGFIPGLNNKQLKNTDLGELQRRGQALGLKGVNPKAFKLLPDDKQVMTNFIIAIRNKAESGGLTPRLSKDAQSIADYLLPGYKYSTNKKLADVFEYILDVNEGTVRQGATIPKMGLVGDDVTKPGGSDIDDTVTLYRASPDLPKGGSFKKGTYFADSEQKARYYSESHYNGNPGDIKVEQFTLPKNLVFKEPSTGNYIIKGEAPVSRSSSPLPQGGKKSFAEETGFKSPFSDAEKKAYSDDDIPGVSKFSFAETPVFSNNLRNALQGASNANDEAQIVKEFTESALKSAKGNDLKALRASLNQELNGIVGKQGSYKLDYALLQQMKGDPNFGPKINALEDAIIKIDQLKQQPISQEGFVRGNKLRIKPIPTQTEIKNTNAPMLSYNAEADMKTQNKLVLDRFKAEEKRVKAEFRKWQTQRNATPTQAIKNIGNSIKQNTVSQPSRNVENYKDIGNISMGLRDVFRNFKAVFGKEYPTVKKLVLDPFDASKGKFIENQKKTLAELDTYIVKKLGIRKGSKESGAVQEYGEGIIDQAKLIEKFGEKKAGQIIEADKWFRANYNKLLDEVNETRARIYPNNPTKLIPKRKDYYRHFKEMSQGIGGLINIFETPAGISSSLSGPSARTKPKSKWLSFAQKRLGNETDVDAVGGFLDYIRVAEYAKNIDPHINSFRQLREELVQATAEGTKNPGKLNNFIEFLDDFANDLSGKTNPLDRPIQKYIPGGRKFMSVLNWANSRVKANMILGNVASTIAQAFNVPQGIASAGPVHATKGLGRAFAGMFAKNDPITKSSFINERYFNAYDKFDTSLLDNTKKFAVWMTQVLDEVGTKYIWQSHYAKALDENIPNPAKYADDMARSLVAGRGIGEVPIMQKSKAFQLVAPFQLEVANLWWVMKDMVDEKAFGKLATLFVANYLFNRGAEEIRGSDVTFDPIQATIESIEAFNEESDKKIGALRVAGRLGGEVLSNVPVGQTLGAMYPEYGNKELGLPTREKLFGEGDPTRFGSGLLVAKGVQDPLFKLLPPFGGGQAKKTIEGMGAYNQGYSEAPSGRVRFPVDKNPINMARSALFGQYGTPEAREFFNKERTTLGEKQSEFFKNMPQGDAQNYYNQVQDLRTQKREGEKQLESQLANEDGGLITKAEAGESSIFDTFGNFFGGDKKEGKKSTLVGNEISYIKGDSIKTIDLKPLLDPKTGISKIIQDKEKRSTAREIYGIESETISPEQKSQIYKRLGLKEDEVAYDYYASQDSLTKAQFIEETYKDLEYPELLNVLVQGRRKSISGDLVTNDATINHLVDVGMITESDAKALKKIDYDKNGNLKTSGAGKKAKKINIAKSSPIKFTGQLRKSSVSKNIIKTSPGVVKVKSPRAVSVKISTPARGRSYNVQAVKIKGLQSGVKLV